MSRRLTVTLTSNEKKKAYVQTENTRLNETVAIETEFDIDKSLEGDPKQEAIDQLFELSGSGSKKNRLGKYQVVLIVVMTLT
jgi:hypothetical protein